MNRTNRKPLGLAILTMVMIMTVQQTAAIERSWSNGGGDSLWSNPSNWATGVAPASNDSVRLANDCPDAPQHIVLDEDAWLTSITCTASDDRHYTLTPLNDQFIRLNATYALSGTADRTVDLTINADIRLGCDYLRVYCLGRDTVLNGNIGPSEQDFKTNVYILTSYPGRLVLAGSNTITHVLVGDDTRVVAANAHALGTYYRTGSAPKSLMLRQSVLMTGGMSPLVTLNLYGPLELGIEENGDEPVELTVMCRMIGHTATMTRGENSRGDFIVRIAGAAGAYSTRWITMEGGALVMNNPSGSITWGAANSDNATISGPGRLICEEPSSVLLYPTNSYTGGTFIRGGTLTLRGDNRLPTNGAVTVESAGTFYCDGYDQIMSELHGNGTNRFTYNTARAPVTNTVTELLSPGVDGPGTLTFTHSGRLMLTPGTRSRFELDTLNGINDRIAFDHSVGHLTLDGTLEVVDLGGMESGDYTLFDLNGGTITGEFDSVILPGNVTGTVEIVGGDVVLRAVKHYGTVIMLR